MQVIADTVAMNTDSKSPATPWAQELVSSRPWANGNYALMQQMLPQPVRRCHREKSMAEQNKMVLKTNSVEDPTKQLLFAERRRQLLEHALKASA